MDSFEINKLAGGLLGVLLVTMGIGIVGDAMFHTAKPAKPGYDLPGLVAETAAAAAPVEEAAPLPVLMAKADPKKGESYAKACATCHNFDKGSGTKVGPSLYGVVNRPIASMAGFQYSETLTKMGGQWTFEAINKFIANPKAYAAGTKMGYAGEKDPQRRADIEAYLRSMADSPAPMPQ